MCCIGFKTVHEFDNLLLHVIFSECNAKWEKFIKKRIESASSISIKRSLENKYIFKPMETNWSDNVRL